MAESAKEESEEHCQKAQELGYELIKQVLRIKRQGKVFNAARYRYGHIAKYCQGKQKSGAEAPGWNSIPRSSSISTGLNRHLSASTVALLPSTLSG